MNPRRASMFVYMVAKIKPEAWDAIIPHGPRVSGASRDYIVAMALKGFSAELGDRAITQKLAGIQQTLVKSASERLVRDYDDDNWCPTPVPKPHIPQPGPFPWFSFDEVMLNPQPVPPKELPKEIGGYLLMLSEATSLDEVAKELQSTGSTLLRS